MSRSLQLLKKQMLDNGHMIPRDVLEHQTFSLNKCITSTMIPVSSINKIILADTYIDWVTTLFGNPETYPGYKKHGKVLFVFNGKTFLVKPDQAIATIKSWMQSNDKKFPGRTVLSRLLIPATTLVEFYKLYTMRRFQVISGMAPDNIALKAA